MRGMQSRAFVFGVMLFAGLLLFSSLAWASGPCYAERGVYVTADGTYDTFSGGLDGYTQYYQGYPPFGSFVLAKPDSGFGWGAGLGYRGTFYSVEFNYYQSRVSDNTVYFGSSYTTLETVSMDLSLYLNAKRQLQPYIMGGIGYSWLYQNGRFFYPYPSTAVANIRFSNFGPNAGAGLKYYITPKLAVDAGFIYRYLHLTKVSAPGGAEDYLTDSIDENVWTVKAGVSYTFDFSKPKKQEF